MSGNNPVPGMNNLGSMVSNNQMDQMRLMQMLKGASGMGAAVSNPVLGNSVSNPMQGAPGMGASRQSQGGANSGGMMGGTQNPPSARETGFGGPRVSRFDSSGGRGADRNANTGGNRGRSPPRNRSPIRRRLEIILHLKNTHFFF